MKTRLPLIAALFLAACAPSIPEIPMTDVPAAPLAHEIDLRSRAFTGLKAVARVSTERKGRTRVYESVAVLAKGNDKLRVEGFGPMGEPLFALVWDGTDLAVRLPGEAELTRTGPWAFERLIGFSLPPAELAAVLSGTVPPAPDPGSAEARCSAGGRCEVRYRRDDALWKVQVVPSSPVEIRSCERFRGSELVYRARFEDLETAGGHLVPKRIIVESADRKASLTVEYLDRELNAPADDGQFLVTGSGAVAR